MKFFFLCAILQIPLLTRLYPKNKKKNIENSNTKEIKYKNSLLENIAWCFQIEMNTKKKCRRNFKEIPKHTINSKAMAHI